VHLIGCETCCTVFYSFKIRSTVTSRGSEEDLLAVKSALKGCHLGGARVDRSSLLPEKQLWMRILLQWAWP
jgi:hypothetical protein